MSLLVIGSAARADPAPIEQTALQRGTERFTVGDFRAAIAALLDARAANPADPDVALLLGIAYFRTGDLARATPALEVAMLHGDEQAQASARVFLGLIAEASGDIEHANGYYASVARSSTELGAMGRLLLDHSGAERWSITLVVRPEVDSNVPVVSGIAAQTAGARDAAVTLLASATARPFANTPLVVDESLAYRRHARLTEFDTLADVSGATYTLADICNRAVLGYHFEASLLGGERYAMGHVVDASYRRELPATFAVRIAYTLAHRDYSLAQHAGYSGSSHTGIAELGWGTATGHAELGVGGVLQRDRTDDPSLTATGFGGQGTLRVRLWRGAELRMFGEAVDRSYDLEANGRHDINLRSDTALFIDLSPTIGLVFGGTVVRNLSNASDYDFVKWTAFAGFVIGASS